MTTTTNTVPDADVTEQPPISRRDMVLQLALLVAKGAPGWEQQTLYIPAADWPHREQLNLFLDTVEAGTAWAELLGFDGGFQYHHQEICRDVYKWTGQWHGWDVRLAAQVEPLRAEVDADTARILAAALTPDAPELPAEVTA